ncbi:hypothetical protein GCM10022207_47170 [Streptomyces lannensis]|uniref:Uncharacterized protein n=1 Tax=Streptomyces lannensis TaxID=766498 RepID=A0ABP7KH74_9ACTN
MFGAVGAAGGSGRRRPVCDSHRRAWGNVLLADLGPWRSGNPCVLATTATSTTDNTTAGMGAQSAYGVLKALDKELPSQGPCKCRNSSGR